MTQMSPAEAARQLDQWGFNVLPARHKGKAPQVDWKKFQSERTTSRLGLWFTGQSPRNYWIATGAISGVVVLDCDSAEGEQWWRDRLGAVLETTTCVRTAKGHHYYFRLPEGQEAGSWSHHDHDTGVSFDVRGAGTGVIAPPSLHESGVAYEWVRDPSHMQPVPSEVLRAQAEAAEQDGQDRGHSMLTYLLQHPKAEGGRNNWLAQVAGHYAKTFRAMRDAYEQHVRAANQQLSPPLGDDEVDKLVESIWASEQRKDTGTGVALAEATLTNGFLVGTGEQILTTIRHKVEGETTIELVPWADFDIRALGVVEDDEARRTYDVEIRRLRQGDTRSDLLPADVFARTDRLAAWLGQHGVGIFPPDQIYPASGTTGERLRRYLESQDPAHFRVVEHLGWSGDGFVVHEGVIRPTGMAPFRGHKPNPKLAGWAPYRYGMESEDTARTVLSRVLTFHDETVCSVYGAWWAACFLKPQIAELVSQFPFMALEAPSESGKTTGFFSLMLQLNGNTRGQVDPTRASLRDSMSAHSSGIVWVDDLSDPQYLYDLLRQATGEGSVVKKGQDKTTQEVVRLVAPVVISGESLALSGQKALMDRAVMLEVPSPVGRRSLIDPSRPQWFDILELKDQFPDLTCMAGNMVQMALLMMQRVGELKDLVPVGGGRHGDKMAILRLGARMLAEMSQDESHVARVDEWCESQQDVGNENTLTLRLLPQALARTGFKSRPEPAEGRWPATPVFVRDGVVWFSPQSVADWWSEIKHGRVEIRTESAEALGQQAKAIPGVDRRRFNIGSDRNHKGVYWGLPQHLSEKVLERSTGGQYTPVSQGVPLNSQLFDHSE